MVHKRILNELKNRLPDFKPKTCLDYGAGLGSGLWAAMHVYSTQENMTNMDKYLTRVAAVEPNVNMRKLGKYLTSEQFNTGDPLWVDSLAMIPSGDRGRFDLILVGYVLQEVPSAKGR